VRAIVKPLSGIALAAGMLLQACPKYVGPRATPDLSPGNSDAVNRTVSSANSNDAGAEDDGGLAWTAAANGGAGSSAGPSGEAGTTAAANGGMSASAANGGWGGSTARSGAGSAATSGSAGAAGAGGSASTFFGASRCGGAGFLVCEDFESGQLDDQLWQTSGTAPKIDAVHAARGSKALHLMTTATGQSRISTGKPFAGGNNRYWGRLFVWFSELPKSPQWAHWSIVGANPTSSSPVAGEIRVGGQFDGTINRFGVGTDGGATGDWTYLDQDPKNAVAPVPEQGWACVEWLHDGSADETRFFWDGVEHPSLHTTRDVHGGSKNTPYDLPQFGSVWVGFWNYDQKQPVDPDHFDVWIDEVALDTDRIGCTR
jgi:hypothetical protein